MLAGLRELIDTAEAAFTHTLAAFDANGDGETLHAAASTQSWLRGALRLAPGDASERVRIARGSRDHLATPLHALAEGAVTYDQVRAIEKGARVVPDEQRQEAVTLLTNLAQQADVSAVRVAGQRLRYVTDPDGALKEADKQFEHRYLNLSPLLDGMTAVDGILDAESATMLNTALAPFLVPAGPTDTRTAGQRRADGLVDLAHAAADHTLLPEIAGQRPHLEILCPLNTLTRTDTDHDQPAPATSPQPPAVLPGYQPPRLGNAPSGALITSTAVRRIACDADLTRVGLNSESVA
ncbi:MAG TPA: DUF222 domain-containing protein, partial [Actinomycetes bacterium]|nr:DUF222 domain-containing protein [Actinomycetes bacterium]